MAAPRNLDSLPWITKDGYLDMLKAPLESTYMRACGDDPQAARDSLGVLSAVFLLGFFVALPARGLDASGRNRRSAAIRTHAGVRLTAYG